MQANFNPEATRLLTNQIIAECEAQYEEYLSKRTAIKNHRTKEGLLSAIHAGVDLFNAEDLPEVTDMEDYEAKLRRQVERSSYFYINEPLIWRVVRKFDNLPIPEMERYEAAAQGFVVAQNIFDPARGFQFSTLAWHLMCNEIIGINKKRIRQTIIKQPDRAIICRDDCTVLYTEKSRDARVIKVKGEPVDLIDIIVEEDSGHQHNYRYIYFPVDGVGPGYKFKRGDHIGYTAGVETEIASMDSFINADDHGDMVFHNPVAKHDESYTRPDAMLMRDSIRDRFREVVNGMSPLEQLIVKERMLPRKPKSRMVIAKEFGITDAKLAKLEADIKHHILDEMELSGITLDDLKVF